MFYPDHGNLILQFSWLSISPFVFLTVLFWLQLIHWLWPDSRTLFKRAEDFVCTYGHAGALHDSYVQLAKISFLSCKYNSHFLTNTLYFHQWLRRNKRPWSDKKNTNINICYLSTLLVYNLAWRNYKSPRESSNLSGDELLFYTFRDLLFYIILVYRSFW